MDPLVGTEVPVISFRGALERDMGFVWNSWLRSFRTSEYAGVLP